MRATSLELFGPPSGAVRKERGCARGFLRVRLGACERRRRLCQPRPIRQASAPPADVTQRTTLDARIDTELVEDVRHVALDGSLGDEELRGRIGVRRPIGHESRHLEFASRKATWRLRCRAGARFGRASDPNAYAMTSSRLIRCPSSNASSYLAGRQGQPWRTPSPLLVGQQRLVLLAGCCPPDRIGSAEQRRRTDVDLAPGSAAKARTSAMCAIPGRSPRSRRISSPERAEPDRLVEVPPAQRSDRQACSA